MVGTVSGGLRRDFTRSPHLKSHQSCSFLCQLVSSGFEWEVQTEKSVTLSVRISFLNITSPCVTPLRSYSPRLQALLFPSLLKKTTYFGLRYPVIRECVAPVSSQESTTQLLNNVYNTSQDLRLCVKTARPPVRDFVKPERGVRCTKCCDFSSPST